MRNKRRLYAIALLAIIWVGSVNTPTRAGTVTGIVEGTADISIQPYASDGQPPMPITTYKDVPSELTYSLGINDFGPTFSFSLTNSVFSFSTADEPGFSQVTSLDNDQIVILSTFLYHVSFTRIVLDFDGSILTGAGYEYETQNTAGSGVDTKTSFTPLADPPGDPPAGVPEPSSIVMAASGALLVLAVVLCKPVA